jgi:TonB family protein
LRKFIGLIAVALLLGGVPSAQGQKASSEKSEKTPRRLVRRVDPVYPRDLQRLSIGGIVRLDVQISARGKVEKINVVGGNPILADSAVKAVKQWQYESAESATNLILNVEFNPQR